MWFTNVTLQVPGLDQGSYSISYYRANLVLMKVKHKNANARAAKLDYIQSRDASPVSVLY